MPPDLKVHGTWTWLINTADKLCQLAWPTLVSLPTVLHCCTEATLLPVQKTACTKYNDGSADITTGHNNIVSAFGQPERR